MKTHWTKYLSEVGTIYSYDGRNQEANMMIIVGAEEKLKQLKQQYKEVENKLKEKVLNGWTQKEIDEAMVKKAYFMNLSDNEK